MENKKINIAKILKDCPTGMELYSPLCGTCVFDRLNMGTIICKKQNTQEITFTSEGYYMLPVFDNCECMLFPSKDQRDWSKFQRPFVDEDIVYLTYKHGLEFIAIFRKIKDNYLYTYIAFGIDGFKLFSGYSFHIDNIKEHRFATEEEKQKLFKAIKEHGYKWNTKTKTLEELIEPKFKVGDKVRHKENRKQYIITKIHKDCYECNDRYVLTFDKQDNYELVPNFDIMNDIIKDDMETITINDFKANTKEWLIDKLHGMIIGDAIKTIGNIHDELHKPQYPKTYEECCMVLKDACMTHKGGYKGDLIQAFQKLLICRDAYWQIAGKEMGLGKPWKPDYDSGVNKYGIICMNGVIQKSTPTTNWERHLNKILDFPTEEMRDTFFENFKDLINECKEFL